MSARHNERRELTKQKENENTRRRFANRHCAIAMLDLDFLGGLGLGLPTNPAFDLGFLEDGDRRRAPLAQSSEGSLTLLAGDGGYLEPPIEPTSLARGSTHGVLAGTRSRRRSHTDAQLVVVQDVATLMLAT